MTLPYTVAALQLEIIELEEQHARLHNELEVVGDRLQITRAKLRSCDLPPSNRNVLFPQKAISAADLERRAAALGFPYYCYDERIHDSAGIDLGSAADFGL